MRLPHVQQRLSCKRILLLLCLVVLILNLFIFWPRVRKYTDVVAHGYELAKDKDNPTDIKQPPLNVNLPKALPSPSLPGEKPVKPTLVEPQPILEVDKVKAKKEVHRESHIVNDGLSFCPDIPPKLIGDLAGLDRDISPQEVEAKVQNDLDDSTPLEPGGKGRPRVCQSRQKLAVIIPYRNRFEHLHILLNNLIPVFRRQQKDFQIFVIEQNMPTVFNRGMLFNVGFLEALKFQQFDCFVFHDVDMVPLNDQAMYTCKDNPLHLAAWTSKWKTGIPYRSYFGGVVMFSKDQFEKINGDSNLYFGWGGEDDDLWNRVKAKGFTPIRYPQRIARYKMIKHKRDHGNEDGKQRFDLLRHGKIRLDKEGLSSTVYTVTEIKLMTLYTWVKVTIDKDEILKKWNTNGTPRVTPEKRA